MIDFIKKKILGDLPEQVLDLQERLRKTENQYYNLSYLLDNSDRKTHASAYEENKDIFNRVARRLETILEKHSCYINISCLRLVGQYVEISGYLYTHNAGCDKDEGFEFRFLVGNAENCKFEVVGAFLGCINGFIERVEAKYQSIILSYSGEFDMHQRKALLDDSLASLNELRNKLKNTLHNHIFSD